MAIPSRAANHGTFFVTSRTYNGRRVFQVERNAALFLETLQHYRKEGYYKLHAFVAMPDHVHLMLTPVDITLERTMQLIKVAFRAECNRNILCGNGVSRIIAYAIARTGNITLRICTTILFVHALPATGRFPVFVSLPTNAPRRLKPLVHSSYRHG